MKKFLELVSKDQTLQAKLKEMNGQTQEEIQKNTIALAAEQGINLRDADFQMENADVLSEDELGAAAGGSGGCSCPIVGGGGGQLAPGVESEYRTWGCACIGYGQGGNGHDVNVCCFCPTAGGEQTNQHGDAYEKINGVREK